MLKDTLVSPFSVFALVFLLASTTFLSVEAHSHRHAPTVGQLVLKHQRKLLTQTEHGEISAASVTDGAKGPYHLQFITLEPNSVFLPVLLHADMVFFVHTGSGTLSWTDDDDDIKNVNIRKGDVYRLQQGSVFYVQSSLEAERERLRIYAIFTNTEDDIYEPSLGAYSSITDMVLGFDSRLLQAAFKVPEDVIEEMMRASKAPAIVHAVHNPKMFGELQARVLKAFLGSNRGGFFGSINGRNKKKMKAYNVLEADPDFENCNGWSVTVDKKDLHFLKHSNIGIFMVNLTKGSMMAPHWNPRAAEIAIVLQGQGMIRVLCSSHAKKSECRNMRYRVEEGDVFAVPRFHPMAQISFNNDSFVFMGFSTSTEKNNPQFLAGKRSALRSLDRDILALSFNVSNAAIDHLLEPQKESVILDCTSCAEEEERLMEEEIERERREEEEARKKKEEEEDRKRREEEAKKREEEEARRKEEEEEEEAAARREEERREEEAKKEQEEAQRQEEERQRKAREKEEAQRRKEEEESQRRKEKEEEIRRKEEARRKKEQEEMREEEEEEKKRREEEAKKEQEEARRQEEERQRKAREEEEKEAQRRKEEEEKRRREEEEEERREEEAMREQEEARRREKERQRKKREEEEETQRREEEAQRIRKEQEKAQRREEEKKERSKEARREKEEAWRQEEERQRRAKEEQEEAWRQEEERQRRAKEEEEWGRHERK
ncbi:hypothetical protein V6N13_086054 [Hibiscus sabdariffa]|uniref:Cupin type-1 domain-containing protein n=1 Tax=Hibiscus sabdariffa TaxID=183260 RepID=A0ABR2FS89_9ROSI